MGFKIIKNFILVFFSVFLIVNTAQAKISGNKFIKSVKTATPDQIVEMLGNGADINSKGAKGMTPLMSALQANNIPAINLLLDNYPDINAYDNKGKTVLMYAIEYGTDYRIIEKIIKNGAGLNTTDKKYGNTALIYTAELRQNENQPNKNMLPLFAKILIQKGADTDIENFDGKTFLGIASYYYDGYLLTYIYEGETKANIRKTMGVPDKILRYTDTNEEWTYVFKQQTKDKSRYESWNLVFVMDNNTVTEVKTK